MKTYEIIMVGIVLILIIIFMDLSKKHFNDLEERVKLIEKELHG